MENPTNSAMAQMAVEEVKVDEVEEVINTSGSKPVISAIDVKLLFLDVDGVINTSAMWPGEMTPMSDAHIMRIGRIIKETECKIVLSTTWRYMANKRKKLKVSSSLLLYRVIHLNDCEFVLKEP